MIWRTYSLVLMILLPIFLAAQPACDLRFIIDQNDQAVGGIFEIRIQIKASNSTFEMGTSNLVFSYNSAALDQNVVLTPLNFSGLISFPPDPLIAYNTMGIAEPLSGAKSLNIVYSTGSSAGQTVGFDWMDVASIAFTINDASSTDLLWRTSAPSRTIIFDPGGSEITHGILFDEIDIPLQPPTSVEEGTADIPTVFQLHPNYPNPFNPSTTLRFDIPATGSAFVDVRLVIYNSLGQAIRTLYQDKSSPGSYEIQWDGRTDFGGNAPSGVYFVVFNAGSFTQTGKLLLLK